MEPGPSALGMQTLRHWKIREVPSDVTLTFKGFGRVNKAEADVFMELFFYDPTDVGNLIADSSTFSKSSLNIRNSHVENFEHYFPSV